MKKLVIIPAYNEAGNIEKTVENIKTNAPDWDFVIVNDCSKDDTLSICRSHGWRVLDLPINLGIGGGMQTGYKFAFENDYDFAVQMDGDGQHDAAYLGKLEEKQLESGADLVIGSRFLEKEGFQSSALRRVGIKYFTWLIRLLTKETITDPTSGMRLANKDVIAFFAESYPKDYPEPDTAVRCLKKGFKLTEVPVLMKEREAGKSSIHGLKSAYYMIKVTIAILLA